ncbi:MAG: hypothetical protein HRF42_03780 [Candidatus Brocadia sp.]|jgi:hypothetical protein
MRAAIIEKFIEEITQGKKGHFERFYEIFSARGFSLELDSNSGKVWLSNDSHREDGEFLEALQDTNYKKKYNKPHQDAIDECDNRGNHCNRHSYFDYIGTQLFDINNNQYLNELFTHEIPVDLFRLNWERDRYGRFEQFKRCEQLPAIRVYDLEPFIARLVKSISTIGISTWSSCEGHWGKPAYIVFDGRYHRTWFQTIFHKFVQKKLNLSCRWDWLGWDERCIVSSPDGNILEMYSEIQDVARLIYDCKIFLRSMKRHVCSLLTAQHKNMDQKGLLHLFEDYFEELIDKIN